MCLTANSFTLVHCVQQCQCEHCVRKLGFPLLIPSISASGSTHTVLLEKKVVLGLGFMQ